MTKRNIIILILIGIACGMIYMVVGVNDLNPLPVDMAVQQFFFNLRTDWLNSVVIFITHIGDPKSIIILCAILLVLPNRKIYGIPVSLSALSGLTIYTSMKHIFLRPRPDTAVHLITQGGYSFPSGHSVESVIVFGLLFYLIRKNCKNEKLKNILSAISMFLACTMGLTRIYVGVHWPSDVITGVCIGGVVLLIAISILERLGKKNENI